MMNFKALRLFCITLFIHLCLPVFLKSDNEKSITPSCDISHDTFEFLMTTSRQHTQSIGFCIQQILQTLDAGKINLASEQKNKVKIQLQQIQKLTNMMLDNLYAQNSKKSLSEAIMLNKILMHFMIDGINKGIETISVEKLALQIQKKIETNTMPEELLLRLTNQNKQNIEKLTYISDRIGLTWYNYAYRFLQQNNAYSIAKACTIATGMGLITGYVLCIADCQYLNQKFPLFNKIIGEEPKFIPNECRYEKEVNGERYNLNYDNATFFQSLVMTSQKLQKSGILSVGALASFSLGGVATKMLKEYYAVINDKSSKWYKNITQILNGTKKYNTGDSNNERVYFKDMVGCEELEALAYKIANFMKYPERYERSQIEEHRGILLYGPPQTGKTLFAKALRTLIKEELGSSKNLEFIDAKRLFDLNCSIDDIFWYAKENAPCILFFDEIDLMGGHRDKSPINTSQLLTCMQGIDMVSKQVIVIGATNRPEQLDRALLVDGRFGKIIHIDYPKYEYRKKFLEMHLTKRCVQLSPEYIDYIAQETEGCSYNNLMRIITEAIILSSIETRPVTQKDFEKALDTEIRKIKPTDKSMSEQEKQIVATYQAGKALALHILKTQKQVVKITINQVIKDVKPTDVAIVIQNNDQKNSENEKLADPKKETKIKLGEVFTKSSHNHTELVSDREQEKECLALLAGNAALKIIMNEQFNDCNKQDRAEAMQIIYKKITHGEKVDDQVRAQAMKIKENYEEQIYKLLSEHEKLLRKIIDVLMQQNTIDRYEWQKLISEN